MLRRAFLGPGDLIIGVLLAYPAADAEAGHRHPDIALHDIPWLDERRRIINRDVGLDRVVIGLAPPFDRLDLVAVIWLLALVLATPSAGWYG